MLNGLREVEIDAEVSNFVNRRFSNSDEDNRNVVLAFMLVEY